MSDGARSPASTSSSRLPGAAGGPKAVGLAGLDRAVFGRGVDGLDALEFEQRARGVAVIFEGGEVLFKGLREAEFDADNLIA